MSFVFILPPLSISRRGQGKKFIWIDRPFDTGYCLIQVTAWEGLPVLVLSVVICHVKVRRCNITKPYATIPLVKKSLKAL